MAKRRKQQKSRPRWKASRIFTWVGLGCLATAIAVVGFFAFTGGSGDAEPRRNLRQTPVISEESQVSVDVVDNDFEPKHLTVRPGTEVTWEFEGRAAHDVTSDEGRFESGTMRRGDEFVITFDEPGTYGYYCTLHHAMQGTLVVEP